MALPRIGDTIHSWKISPPDMSNRGFLCTQQGVSAILLRLYSSTALRHFFYEVSKKSLHTPRANFRNMLFKKIYSFSYYLQLLCLQFLSRTHLLKKKFTLGIKKALFLKSSLYQSINVKLYTFKIKLPHIS
jgi:hypothetical protein